MWHSKLVTESSWWQSWEESQDSSVSNFLPSSCNQGMTGSQCSLEGEKKPDKNLRNVTAERDWLWNLAFDTRQRITHNCILASVWEQDTSGPTSISKRMVAPL